MRSTSSIIKQHLMAQEVGYTFTAEDLADLYINEGVKPGGISGFLSKGLAVEALADTGRNGRCYIYTLVDKAALESMKVRSVSSAGSQPGRRDGPHKSRQAPTREAITQRLLELAAELEQMRTPLEQFSTDELLQELLRRQRS